MDKFEADLEKISRAVENETDPEKISALMSREVYESIGDRFIHGLMQLGDRDLAEARANKIDTSEMMWKSDRLQSTRDSADFYQLIDKDLGVTKISPKDCNGRACARSWDNSIGLPDAHNGKKRRTSQFHEMAHFAEFRDSSVGKRAEDWVKERAKGSALPLSELTGHAGYANDETALPDDFIHPYIGKLYGNGITEVHSMGLQHFADGRKVVELFKQDRRANAHVS